MSARRSGPAWRAALGLAALGLAGGCDGTGQGSGTDGASVCGGGLVPGDLVVTEVMANPIGDDDGGEWFEIFNASPDDLDLGGVTLATRKVDGSGEHLHVMAPTVIGAGEYLVAGDVLPELAPAWIDYGYGGDLGSLVNGGGEIALSCGDVEIDGLAYPGAPGAAGGVSIVLDGNIVPDAIANDDPANLCPSTAAFASVSGVVGSPGEPNEACDTARPGTCEEDGVARAVRSPAVGDVVISEIMASPTEVGDADGEWFELYAAAAVDLNGVVVGRTIGTPQASIEGRGCVHLEAGDYALLARSADPATNGGLPEVDATFGFNLVGGSEDSPGTLYVGLGDEILDEVSWTASEDGASRALVGDRLDPSTNDDAANWTTCGAGYGAGADRGTPGASNDACGEVVASAMCDDGGTLRPIARPGAGDLRIAEVFANPVGNDGAVAVRSEEWIELEASAAFDLNGLGLGENATDAVEATIDAPACLPVTAGQRVIVARSADPAANGGLPAVDAVVDLTLGNSAGRVFVASEGVVLDAFTYGTPAEGRSSQLDPDGTTICKNGVSSFGSAGGFGTPGAANPACDEL